MEVKAHIKYVKMSPQKVRGLVDSVKVLSPKVALDHLSVSQRRAAKALFKAIKSAVSNGQAVPGFDVEKARFKRLSVDEGPAFKRFRAGARGTAKPYVRRTSHIIVILEQDNVKPSAVKKTAQKVENAKPKTVSAKGKTVAESPMKEMKSTTKVGEKGNMKVTKQVRQVKQTTSSRTTNK